MKHAGLYVVAIALGAITARPSDGAVLCKKKSAVVVAREECKKSETPVDLAQFGAVGPQGPPGVPGGLVVRDASGAVIGPLVGGATNGTVWAAHTTGLLTVALPVNESGFVENPYLTSPDLSNVFAASFVYENANCSGTSWLSATNPVVGGMGPSELLLPRVRVLGSTGYYPTGPTSTRAIQSQWFLVSDASNCPGTFSPPSTCCYNLGSPAMWATSAVGTLDLPSLGFVPPFSVGVP